MTILRTLSLLFSKSKLEAYNNIYLLEQLIDIFGQQFLFKHPADMKHMNNNSRNK